MSLQKIRKELKKYASKEKAEILQRFFKTGPGEYGEGDVFIGVKVPELRSTAKKFKNISMPILKELLRARVHEERMLALLILIQKFQESKDRGKLVKLYLRNTRHINNWDLVDLSAPKIIGEFLLKEDRAILYTLARSDFLWERRISIISTLQFIRKDQFKDTLKISKILLKDEEALIQKAVGWMLREVGKRNIDIEEKFLRATYTKMPRTMLRYAIERFPEKKRQAYLKGKI